ncbi:MAG: sulfurtransferase complex subunit TusD [Motiliproteus sp.]|nr:sulfurtransferase complex subunit TusD [Motiliproteus sp.]MCW9053914.1 sulfurtransferase complex subunit TusD [Motiliproteus sp.]
MKLSILVYGSPNGSQAAATAYRFTKAALEKGHEIYRVFFYGDGVYAASALNTPPQDEQDLSSLWRELGEQHNLDMVVCIAAALKRGVLDPGEAKRFEKSAHNLSAGFTLSGLGQMMDASQQSDRMITFGY